MIDPQIGSDGEHGPAAEQVPFVEPQVLWGQQRVEEALHPILKLRERVVRKALRRSACHNPLQLGVGFSEGAVLGKLFEYADFAQLAIGQPRMRNRTG